MLYDDSISKAKPTHLIEKRIANIEDHLTKSVWRYTSRGLYEKHKFLFTLLLALKIDLNNGNINHQEFLTLLKGGAALDLNSVQVKKNWKCIVLTILQPKLFRWMLDIIWLNLVELSHLEPFKDLLGMVSGLDQEW